MVTSRPSRRNPGRQGSALPSLPQSLASGIICILGLRGQLCGSGPEQERRDENTYDTAQLCLNGHKINARARSEPERNAEFCSHCGEKTITACPHCKADIRGDFCVDQGWDRWRQGWLIPPSHCHGCGQPYPWTQRAADALAEAIDVVEGLTEEDRDKLKKSIPDITAETPKSGTATLLFKKMIGKAGEIGSKVLIDVLAKVATEAAKQQMGLP